MAREWAEGHADDLNQLEKQFLESSVQVEQEEELSRIADLARAERQAGTRLNMAQKERWRWWGLWAVSIIVVVGLTANKALDHLRNEWLKQQSRNELWSEFKARQIEQEVQLIKREERRWIEEKEQLVKQIEQQVKGEEGRLINEIKALIHDRFVGAEDYLSIVRLAYLKYIQNKIALADQLLQLCPERQREWEWYYVYYRYHANDLSRSAELI